MNNDGIWTDFVTNMSPRWSSEKVSEPIYYKYAAPTELMRNISFQLHRSKNFVFRTPMILADIKY